MNAWDYFAAIMLALFGYGALVCIWEHLTRSDQRLINMNPQLDAKYFAMRNIEEQCQQQRED